MEQLNNGSMIYEYIYYFFHFFIFSFFYIFISFIQDIKINEMKGIFQQYINAINNTLINE